jgi:hypothetical protein
MKHLKLLILIFIPTFITNLSLYSQAENTNSVYLGLSAGHNIIEEHSEFSIMGGYDRHFEGTPEFTLGILAEGVFGQHTEFMLGIPIGFYPIEELKLWLAPCYTLNGNEKKYYEDEEVEYMKTESRFMLKLGIGYNYHFHETNAAMLPFIEGTLVGQEFVLSVGIKFNFYFSDFWNE